MREAICATRRAGGLFILIAALAFPFIARTADFLRFGGWAVGGLNGDVLCFILWFVHQLISSSFTIISRIFDEVAELNSCTSQ